MSDIDLNALVDRLNDYGGPSDIIQDCRKAGDEINRLRAINAELLTIVKWCLEYDGGECLGDHPQRLRFAQTVALTAADASKGE